MKNEIVSSCDKAPKRRKTKGIAHWKIDPPVQLSKFGLFQNPPRMHCSVFL
jgi:hypothetical protein